MSAMKRDDILLAQNKTPVAVAAWFAGNFGFSTKAAGSGILLESENLKWYWAAGTGEPSIYGFQHVALASSDIDSALTFCQRKGLDLDTDNGNPYFNPKVWGKGTRYFNIRTPFGFILEICQRMDLQYEKNAPVIGGLEHVGIFASDIGQTERFYQSIGFKTVYPQVRNEKEGASVLCTMLSDGCLMLEVFSILGNWELPSAAYSGISEILIYGNAPNVWNGPDEEVIKMAAMAEI